jgi:organic radical activating enzyme
MTFENFELSVFITGRCNKRCAHCYVANILVKAKDPTADLDLTTFKNALLSFSGLLKEDKTKLKRILIAGGEPTLHPDFKQFVLFASRFTEEVQIDTNLTTMPQTENEIAEHLKWLPKNVTFMIGFDNYHYPNLTPEFELKLLNFIKYCVRTHRKLIINSVTPKLGWPKVKNPRLAEYLVKFYINDLKHDDEPQLFRNSFRFKSSRIGNATRLPDTDTKEITPESLHEQLTTSNYLTIFPNSNVYVSSTAIVFPLNSDNMFYRGSIKKEKLVDIFIRQQYRTTNIYGRQIKKDEALAHQKKIDELEKTEQLPSFIAYLRRMTNYEKQKKLREHTLKRLREMLRRR